MYNYRKISDDIFYIGASDRRLALFENVYPVPNGVSYNSYVVLDEKTVLFDTVDHAVSGVFFENLAAVLAENGGRELDYAVVSHVEPDHAGTLNELILRYPNVTLVVNSKSLTMIENFNNFSRPLKIKIVSAGETLETGKHSFVFVPAPMVHWPEVMVTYDAFSKTLFSADAFGTFGALGGAIFADEADFETKYLDEARRYYAGIVGKYGTQVNAVLDKAADLDISVICPLHGPIWRNDTGWFVDKYRLWANYIAEEQAVLIVYGSIYGHTQNAAEILASKLNELGVKTALYDAAVTDASYILADVFKYSHIVFASATYNSGVFQPVENLLHDIKAHQIQNKTVAIIENGSWAAQSGAKTRALLSELQGFTILEDTVSIRSSVKDSQLDELTNLAEKIAGSFPKPAVTESKQSDAALINPGAFFKLSYGLFVLSAKDGGKDNGCIVNTVIQLTDNPKRIIVAVNKANLTHDMIMSSKKFCVSVLSEKTPFEVFTHFGFNSGREVDKFANTELSRDNSGLVYLPYCANAYISGNVIDTYDYETHTLFVAEVTEAAVLSADSSVTYAYYFAHIKPKPKPQIEKKRGYICKICGYFHEGEELPPDIICPLCKHGADDFERNW